MLRRLPRTATFLLAFIAAFMALRFLWLGDTVYILDEAFQQIRIDEHFAAGTIPFSNSRGSSIPLPYGPGALWILMIIRLFTWHPVWIAFYHLCYHILGYGLFAWALWRAYGKEAAIWSLAVVACSPLLFFLSRHPWDSTYFVALGGAIILLLERLEKSRWEGAIHAGLGAIAGYAVNTHLMFGPVAVALLGTLILWNIRKHGGDRLAFFKNIALFGGSALLILTPYLFEAYKISLEERPMAHTRNQRWGDGRNLWWVFARTTIFNSTFQARALLNDLRQDLYAFAGQPFAFFFQYDIFGWPAKLAAWGLAIASLWRIIRLRFDGSLFEIFSGLSFFFLLLIFQYLNIPMAQHYFLPGWWFVFIGTAQAVRSLRGIWRKIFLFSLAGTIFVNASYVVFTMAFIHKNRGARNMDASVAVSEQMRNLGVICAWGRENNKSSVLVFRDAFIGEPGFEFLSKHMPECSGVSVKATDYLSQADIVVHHPKDSRTSAALVSEPVKKQ